MVDIRKIITMREMVLSELGVAAPRPVVRAVGMAVILNPFAGRVVEDLRPLFEAGAMLGERLMPDLVKLLDGPAVSYGKGALVGVDGEMEHGGACVHPMLGKPMRAAVGGGKAVISSNVKIAAAGASLDVPLGHKDDSWSFPHFDTITVSVADAPRPNRADPVTASSPPSPRNGSLAMNLNSDFGARAAVHAARLDWTAGHLRSQPADQHPHAGIGFFTLASPCQRCCSGVATPAASSCTPVGLSATPTGEGAWTH